jgi:hypothetical protein
VIRHFNSFEGGPPVRNPTISAAVILAAIFAAGCSDRNAPAELSGDPGFDQAPVVETFEIEPFTFDNPCTGDQDVVSGTQTVRFHFFETETDPVRHHFNVEVRTEIETEAGFSGFDLSHFTDMGFPAPGAEDEEFSSTFTLNVKLSNDSGERVKGHVTSHTTRMRDQNGDLVLRSDFVKVSFRCV